MHGGGPGGCWRWALLDAPTGDLEEERALFPGGVEGWELTERGASRPCFILTQPKAKPPRVGPGDRRAEEGPVWLTPPQSRSDCFKSTSRGT